jgi:hypothetical protein
MSKIHLVLSEEDAKLLLRYLYCRPLHLISRPELQLDAMLYGVIDQLEDKLEVPGRAKSR